MKYCMLPLLLFVPLSMFTSCTSTIYKVAYPTLIDGKYDSEFPYRGCSQQLEEIISSVKRVNVLVHFKTFQFTMEDSVSADRLVSDIKRCTNAKSSYEHQTVAGTATVILNDRGTIVLITCAHLMDFPDTLVHRFYSEDYQPTPFVHSLSIKTGQSIFLNEVSPSTSFEILALDRSLDLALIGQKLETALTPQFKPFAYPLGRAKDLEWGSFVYLFGYPAGHRMITKGIVSPSNKQPSGSFLVDAVISPGSSGSIALAVRDGVPNFELVGIVKMIPVQSSYVLTPSKSDIDTQFDPLEVYHGDIFIERKSEMLPGIVQAVPVESIVDFVREHRKSLAARGYNLTDWLAPHTKDATPSPQQ
jgi:hypothetical protein